MPSPKPSSGRWPRFLWDMVYRGLPYFAQAYRKGEATDRVAYLAAHTELLGIVKRKRKPDLLPALLDLTTLEEKLNL